MRCAETGISQTKYLSLPHIPPSVRDKPLSKKKNPIEALMAALAEADKIRAQLREDPEILDQLAGSLQELDDRIEETQKVLTGLNAERAVISNQLALIKGTTAKKGKKGEVKTRGKAKEAALWINSQGLEAVITPSDLKVPEIGMVGGYPGTWLSKMAEAGYFEKIAQGEYKLLKLLPV